MAIVALIFWSMLAASLVLTWAGLARGAWRQLALAAVLSLLFSIVALFSIGPFTFLLTCLQAGAALAIARNYRTRGQVASLLGGLAVWLLVVAVPLAPYWF